MIYGQVTAQMFGAFYGHQHRRHIQQGLVFVDETRANTQLKTVHAVTKLYRSDVFGDG